MASYHLKIVTPKGTAFETEVTHTLFPDERGLVGVLANHAPFVSSSPGGPLTLRLVDGSEKKFLIGSGFFEVAKNSAVFLVGSLQAGPGQ